MILRVLCHPIPQHAETAFLKMIHMPCCQDNDSEKAVGAHQEASHWHQVKTGWASVVTRILRVLCHQIPLHVLHMANH